MLDYSKSSWAITMCLNSLAFNAIARWGICEYHPNERLGDPAKSLTTELLTANIRVQTAKIFNDPVPIIYLKYAN